jgi:chaperonin cofactor prefoldin
MAMMDTLEAIRRKLEKLEKEIDTKFNKLEKEIDALAIRINSLQSNEASNRTEFKYMKILLSISLAANGYIGFRMGLPKL